MAMAAIIGITIFGWICVNLISGDPIIPELPPSRQQQWDTDRKLETPLNDIFVKHALSNRRYINPTINTIYTIKSSYNQQEYKITKWNRSKRGWTAVGTKTECSENNITIYQNVYLTHSDAQNTITARIKESEEKEIAEAKQEKKETEKRKIQEEADAIFYAPYPASDYVETRGGIYSVYHIRVGGLDYVGFTGQKFESRLLQHLTDGKTKVQKELLKQNYQFNTVSIKEYDNKVVALQAERTAIASLPSNRLNKTPGGEGGDITVYTELVNSKLVDMVINNKKDK